MAKRHYPQGEYAGMESRRRQEREDGGMISEDKSAIANLPQNVMIKAYSRPAYSSYNLNDDIKGIDVQIRDDVKKEDKKGAYPEKY